MRTVPALALALGVEFIVAVTVGTWATAIPFGLIVFAALVWVLPVPRGVGE